MKLRLLILTFLFCSICFVQAQQKSYDIHTIAFYNLENLFDTIRNEKIYDEEWTPKGQRKWDTRKYRQKFANLSRAISEIGTAEHSNMPTILGVCEVENKAVLERSEERRVGKECRSRRWA